MIEIKLFGPTDVSVDGKRAGAAALGGAKPRQILEMLAADLGTAVSKERLADGLWEDEPPARYLATLESYVCVLRRGLGVGRGKRSVLATTHRGYVLDPEQVQVDLVEFRRLMTAALEGPRHAAPDHAEKALALAARDLLADDPYAAWAGRQRDAVNRLVTSACTEAALVANEAGESDRAIRLARVATEQGLLVEAPWQALMVALWRAGRRPEALGAYADLRAATIEELGVEPGAASQELYMRILREDQGAARTRGREVQEVRTLVRLLSQALGGTLVTEGDPGVSDGLRAILGRTA